MQGGAVADAHMQRAELGVVRLDHGHVGLVHQLARQAQLRALHGQRRDVPVRLGVVLVVHLGQHVAHNLAPLVLRHIRNLRGGGAGGGGGGVREKKKKKKKKGGEGGCGKKKENYTIP